MQKAITSANGISPSQLRALSTNPSIGLPFHGVLDEAIALSEAISTLQTGLLRTDGLSPPPKKRSVIPCSEERDYAIELLALSMDESILEVSYHPHLIQTLEKWSAKTQAVAPAVLLPAGRTSFKNTMACRTVNPGVVEVIDTLLRSDTRKLLARTRSYKRGASEDDIVTDNEVENAQDANVFDDVDFYQQLLHDVIESRRADGGVEGSEQEWIQRQKARKAKQKKAVDTKASKGRKLRYQVHEKLQHFMPPISTSHGAWHEKQIDELFASLVDN